MNWSKAKNILIITFLLVNSFLFYIWINIDEGDSDRVDNEYRNMVIQLLDEHNIQIDTEIPSIDENIPDISVKYQIYNPNDDRYSKFNIPEHNKLITYESESTERLYRGLDKDKAKKIAIEFINQNGFNNNDIKLWSVTLDNDSYTIEYKQQYNGMIFDDGFMKLKINGTGVYTFERRWLIVEDEKYNNKQRIIDPYESIMLVMDMLPKDKSKITDMALTYKMTVNEAINTQWFNIDHGTLSPYWKIRFSDSTYIDVKAYQ